MYDKGKILFGLLIFFGLLSIPLWYTVGQGSSDYVPELDKAVRGDTCVMADVAEMRANHMDLLNEWRDLAVREGVRTHTTEDGRKFTMSLTNTCLDCHKSKAGFCDKCHDYLGVTPYCWECHVVPEDLTPAAVAPKAVTPEAGEVKQ